MFVKLTLSIIPKNNNKTTLTIIFSFLKAIAASPSPPFNSTADSYQLQASTIFCFSIHRRYQQQLQASSVPPATTQPLSATIASGLSVASIASASQLSPFPPLAFVSAVDDQCSVLFSYVLFFSLMSRVLFCIHLICNIVRNPKFNSYFAFIVAVWDQ